MANTYVSPHDQIVIVTYEVLRQYLPEVAAAFLPTRLSWVAARLDRLDADEAAKNYIVGLA
jgi:hypothetical protein